VPATVNLKLVVWPVSEEASFVGLGCARLEATWEKRENFPFFAARTGPTLPVALG